MTESKQLSKLKRILVFHGQKLEFLKVHLIEQNVVVSRKQAEFNALARELETQQDSKPRDVTAFDRQLLNHLLDAIETKLGDVRAELYQAQVVLRQRRAELRKHMTKMESLEKLMARKMESISLQHRRHDQHQADERYLNTNFTG